MILIIEDEEALARVYTRALCSNGFEADYVLNGRDAVAWLNLYRADLLMIDLGLPDINGFELLDRIRHMGVDAPAVSISGYRDIYREDRLSEFTAVLDKPLKLAELIETVGRYLRPTTGSETPKGGAGSPPDGLGGGGS